MDIVPGKTSQIDRGEALALLGSVPLGRIVFTDRALPAVRLVSHLVEAGMLIVCNNYGAPIVSGDGPGGRATVVAYEADDIDPVTHAGWSVVVTGTATLVTRPADIARYRRVLRPPATARASQLIRVDTGIVAGYRLAPCAG